MCAQKTGTFDKMFHILASVSSDGNFSGNFDAPVFPKVVTWQLVILFAFIYFYIFILHVFYFNILDLN